MSELQIHYQIIFNNFKERYISDDPGIVSSLLADLRNEDMDIARKTFSQYARGDFVFSYNYCTTLHDLYVEIYNHLGFETEINNRGIMNPVYIYEKLLYIRIQPSSHKLVDLIKDFSIGKTLIYIWNFVQLQVTVLKITSMMNCAFLCTQMRDADIIVLMFMLSAERRMHL